MWSFPQGYRETVLQTLPQLTALDGRTISGEPVHPAEGNHSDLKCLEDIWDCLVSSGRHSSRDQVSEFMCTDFNVDKSYFCIACNALM